MEQRSTISNFMLGLAAFIVVVAGMKAAEAILVPFLLSLFIAVICTPPLLWLKAKGVPGWLSMLIVIANVAICGLLVGAIVGAAIADFKQDLPAYQERLTSLTGSVFGRLEAHGISVDIERLRSGFNPAAALSVAGNTLASLGNLMTNAFMILLTVVFILGEEVGFSEKLKSTSRNSEKTVAAIQQFTSGVNRYMAIKALMSLVTGIMILAWLWFLDVDYFVLWGTLAFLLNFVPTLGSIIAAVPAVLLALVQLGIGDAVLVALGFLAANFGVGNVMEPRLMGRGLDLSTLVVFLSLVFWGWVLGPVGMLLSVPLTMTVKIALESFDETRWLGVLLSSGRGLIRTQLALGRLSTDDSK